MRLPADPPSFTDLLHGQGPEGVLRLISSGIGKQPANRYLHWSKLKYMRPPEGFTVEDWWAATKMVRAAAQHILPLADEDGRPFAFTDSGYLHHMLHEVDLHAGGGVAL